MRQRAHTIPIVLLDAGLAVVSSPTLTDHQKSSPHRQGSQLRESQLVSKCQPADWTGRPFAVGDLRWSSSHWMGSRAIRHMQCGLKCRPQALIAGSLQTQLFAVDEAAYLHGAVIAERIDPVAYAVPVDRRHPQSSRLPCTEPPEHPRLVGPRSPHLKNKA